MISKKANQDMENTRLRLLKILFWERARIWKGEKEIWSFQEVV